MAEAGVPVGRREQLDLNLDSCCDELVFFLLLSSIRCIWMGSMMIHVFGWVPKYTY